MGWNLDFIITLYILFIYSIYCLFVLPIVFQIHNFFKCLQLYVSGQINIVESSDWDSGAYIWKTNK